MIEILLLLGLDDWPAFRGPEGNGLSREKAAPSVWGPDRNIRWRAPLPMPGNGSPIVSGGRVFVTSAEDSDGKRRSLWCFDRSDGKKLWSRTVEFPTREATHNTNPHCATTPAADAERVVVWHGSAGLYCYDHEGRELWKRDFGEFGHMWGYASSPLIYRGRVILNSGPGKRRVFVAALDLASGKTVWETPEPFQGDGDYNELKKYMGSWSTPIVVRSGDVDQIVCPQPTRVAAYDPLDGKVLWWCGGVRHGGGDLAYSSPVAVGDMILVTGGFGGPGLGIRLGGSGDVTASHRLWRTEKNPQSIGSGVAVGGVAYVPFADGGRIDCIDPKTGSALWMEKTGQGAFWGSIVWAAERCYATSQRGATVVFRPSPERFELGGINRLNEPTNSTPAVSNGEIFLRTHKNLWCIAER